MQHTLRKIKNYFDRKNVKSDNDNDILFQG